jgi:hypothetical protein
LRFANPSPPSGWIEDLHLQALDHARHTTKKPGGEARLFQFDWSVSELVVQAKSANRRGRLGVEAEAATTSQRRHGSRAEVHIKGFELDGEVIGQSMLDAAAEGPAGTRSGETLSTALNEVGSGCRIRQISPGNTARDEQQGVIRGPSQTAAHGSEIRDAGDAVTANNIEIGAVAGLRAGHAVIGLDADDPWAPPLVIVADGPAGKNSTASVGVGGSGNARYGSRISVLRRKPDGAGARSEVEAGPAERSGIYWRLHRKRHVGGRRVECQRDRRDRRKKPSSSLHFLPPIRSKTGPNAQALVKLYRGIADVCSFSVTVEKNRFYYD